MNMEMPGSDIDRLQTEIALEAARRDAAKLTRTADWEKRMEIEARYRRERNRINRAHHRDRPKRLTWVKQSLAKRHDLNLNRIEAARTPHDKALKAKLTRRAEAEVDKDHARRLAHCDERETEELNDLVETARDRKAGPQPSTPQKRITDQSPSPTRPPQRRR